MSSTTTLAGPQKRSSPRGTRLQRSQKPYGVKSTCVKGVSQLDLRMREGKKEAEVML
jgi:hypothetical protein